MELENIHDPAQVFEPIHRVVTGCDPKALRKALESQACAEGGFPVTWYAGEESGTVLLDRSLSELAVGVLQGFLDSYLADHPGEVDYIHDDDALIALAKQPNAIGFLLPAMEKNQLFRGVIADGILPRKTFSMGQQPRKTLLSRRKKDQMTTLTEGAFAKINLTLDVLDRREDGYHDIRSILQTVALRDDIELLLDTGTGWHIECETAGIPLDETNLAWRAARVFFDTFGGEPDGLTIRITKRIPSGAGLGGGSADAAAVLRALNRWKDYPLSVYALCELGAQIGSDVPFCVLCGTALAEGRGERLTKLPDTPEMFTVICKPDVSFFHPGALCQTRRCRACQAAGHARHASRA